MCWNADHFYVSPDFISRYSLIYDNTWCTCTHKWLGVTMHQNPANIHLHVSCTSLYIHIRTCTTLCVYSLSHSVSLTSSSGIPEEGGGGGANSGGGSRATREKVPQVNTSMDGNIPSEWSKQEKPTCTCACTCHLLLLKSLWSSTHNPRAQSTQTSVTYHLE